MSAVVDPRVLVPHRHPPPGRRVAVVDEDDATRKAVGAMLAAGGLDVSAGAVVPGRIADLRADPPDALVLVVDVARPAGLAALRRARGELPATPVVVVQRSGGGTHAARQSLNAGAHACIPEAAAARSLAAAVRSAIAGLVCVPAESRRLVARPAFAHREKEVLGLLVTGLTNRQIAGRLFLAESTVKSHVASAFAKLGVRSRQEATSLLLDPAEDLGTIALPPPAQRSASTSR